MIFQSVEIIHLQLPFTSGFEHARKSRHYSDTLLLKLRTECGLDGWGEILPRPYVTGESIDAILSHSETAFTARSVARSLAGLHISSQQDLEQWIDAQLSSYQEHTALFGGLELAMWSVLSQAGKVDLSTAIGPINERATQRCITIGFDACTDDLRARAIDARFKKASVVKLKIGQADDIERLKALDGYFNGNMPIRVDANGEYDRQRLAALLEACSKNTALQSVEQPLSHTDNDIAGTQTALFEQYQIPFVADESVCSIQDAQRWIKTGGFQIFNLRVGKHGGLRASCKVRDMANAQGIGLVSGSMVGESGVLTQASELLLSRSAGFNYVEGLGQNQTLLAFDPVEIINSSGPLLTFKLTAQAQDHIVTSQIHNCN